MSTTLRMKAVICLVSFCCGLMGPGIAPLVAQTVTTMSPDARAAESAMWQNPYYRAMHTPYYNPAMNPQANPYGMPYLANHSHTGTGMMTGGYFDPMQDPRFSGTHGDRFQPDYYYPGQQTQGYQLPGILGAVAGLAIGASSFGVVGAVLGGVGGYFLGRTIGNWILPPGLGTPYGMQTSRTPLMVGAVGALAGAFAFKFMGPIGWLVGGTLGFVTAQWLTRTLAPQFYYYGFQRPGSYPPHYADPGAYYYAPGTTPPAVDAPAAPEDSPADAPTAPADGLAGLQLQFYDAMRAYRSALTGAEDLEAQEAARVEYLRARDAYMQAKEEALQ